MSLYVAPDEPSIVLDTKHISLVLWFGPLKDWRVDYVDSRVNQNPHWQVYFGPFSLIRWLP